MSDYWDIFNPKNPWHGGIRYNGTLAGQFTNYLRNMDFVRNYHHGGARAFMDSLPISGSIRRFNYSMQEAEDRYANSGVDEKYSSPYASPIPLLNDALGGVRKAARMGKSLMDVYTPEVAFDALENMYG